MVTGANGNLGKRLVKRLLQEHEVVAVVRSNKAAETVKAQALSGEEKSRLGVEILDYTDVQALTRASQGVTNVVHLVGILKETQNASYVAAHEESCDALNDALRDSSVEHIAYLSIVGSHPAASNACLASKVRAEEILIKGRPAVAILRVPMVLGEGDYASFALRKRAQQRLSLTFRASSIEQPVYAGDVVEAIINSGAGKIDAVLDLGGPEAMTRRALTQRAAKMLGKQSTVVSLPVALGYFLASIFERISSNPPFTKAMLGVLDHDDAIESNAGWQTLGMSAPTSVDDMLAAVLTDATH